MPSTMFVLTHFYVCTLGKRTEIPTMEGDYACHCLQVGHFVCFTGGITQSTVPKGYSKLQNQCLLHNLCDRNLRFQNKLPHVLCFSTKSMYIVR
jgi:hypothetical protein